MTIVEILINNDVPIITSVEGTFAALVAQVSLLEQESPGAAESVLSDLTYYLSGLKNHSLVELGDERAIEIGLSTESRTADEAFIIVGGIHEHPNEVS